MKIKIDVERQKILLNKLEYLSNRMQRNVLTRAAVAGAEVIAGRARELAPSKNRRRLKERWAIHAVINKKNKTFVEVSIGHAKQYFWGAILEYGSGPHPITITNKKTGKTRTVRHPGTRAYPHMRPAFDQMTKTAITKIEDELEKEILKAAKK